MNKRKSINKTLKGTHVSIVLSLIIFMGFLFFLIIIFQPAFTTNTVRDIYLDYLKGALDQMLTENLQTLTINVTIKSGQDCISLKDIVIPIEEQGMDSGRLIIKNENDEILNYTVKSKDLWINSGSSFNGFLKVYYSKELNTSYCFLNPAQCGITGCSPQGDNYDIKIINEGEEMFESKIDNLVDWYLTDYEGLKDALNIPEGMEFDFSLSFENNEGAIIEASRQIPQNQNVYVQDIPVLYIDEWGNLRVGTLTLKIWESI